MAGLGGLLAAHRGGSLAVQAFVAEWGAGRLGVAWSDPEAPAPTSGTILRKVGAGALFGLGAAAAAIGFAVATGAATVALASVSATGVLIGVLTAGLLAMRDELVLRGLVLRAFRHTVSPPLQLVVCGAVAAAARLGQTPDSGSSTVGLLAVAALGGASVATLWLRGRGAWTAWAANAAFRLATTTLFAGALFDARWRASPWGGGTLGVDASLAVAVALAVVAAVAVTSWYRSRARTG